MEEPKQCPICGTILSFEEEKETEYVIQVYYCSSCDYEKRSDEVYDD
jgi:DNA-directed RNA polymerase subunit M/transcription elongation factor TFIIS